MDLERYLSKKKRMLSLFVLAARLGLGFMFIVSSVPKMRQPHAFLGSVYGYELVGPKLGMLVAMVLPPVELFAGVCLVGGVFIGGALLVSMSMGVLFSFVLASALWRHLDISCGCFASSTAEKIGYSTLLRAIVIALVSGAAYGATILMPARNAGSLSAPHGQDKDAPHGCPTPTTDAGGADR